MDVVLTKETRQTLTAMQKFAVKVERAQRNLQSGNKVNDAVDNAEKYYAAKGLTDTAQNFLNVKDEMSDAVSLLKTTLVGCNSIQVIYNQMKGMIETLKTADTATRTALCSQWDDLLTQIANVARDSSYQGKTLLNGGPITYPATFNSADYWNINKDVGLETTKVNVTSREGGGDLELKQIAVPLEDPTHSVSGALVNVNAGQAISFFNPQLFDKSVHPGNLANAYNNQVNFVKLYQYYSWQSNAFQLANPNSVNDKTLAIYGNLDINDINGTFTADLWMVGWGTQHHAIGIFQLTNLAITNDMGNILDANTPVKEITANIKLVNWTSPDPYISARYTDNLFMNGAVFDHLNAGSNNYASPTAANFGLNVPNPNTDLASTWANNCLSYMKAAQSYYANNLDFLVKKIEFSKSMENTLNEGAGKLQLCDLNQESAELAAMQLQQQIATQNLNMSGKNNQSIISLLMPF